VNVVQSQNSRESLGDACHLYDVVAHFYFFQFVTAFKESWSGGFPHPTNYCIYLNANGLFEVADVV
jgi:hypothetical protein